MSFFLLLLFLLSFSSRHSTKATDLNSDREALLEFASSVPHIKKLNWNASDPEPFTPPGLGSPATRTIPMSTLFASRGWGCSETSHRTHSGRSIPSRCSA
ncbi:unnamed protein product [Linum trigynum]|uniref:Uncharacterized protein n=1 Tax=Linum trigynum TaxID=586398 RepID=A0AAV2F7U5_9ROSI